MTDTKSQPQDDLTEAEIAARFESTVRRMANTPPSNKLAKQHAALAAVDAEATLADVAIRTKKTKLALASSKKSLKGN